MGSFFFRLEIHRRPSRTKTRERTLTRKSDRERFTSPSIDLGRSTRAERQARQAVELDPLRYIARQSRSRSPGGGKLDEADAVSRKAADLQPAAAGIHRYQVLVAVQRGDGETALREARLEPDEGYRRFELALAHYVRGDRAAADAALADLIANDETSGLPNR